MRWNPHAYQDSSVVPPGSYRLVAPLPGNTVRLALDGRTITLTGRRYPLRNSAGETVRLVVVIVPSALLRSG